VPSTSTSFGATATGTEAAVPDDVEVARSAADWAGLAAIPAVKGAVAGIPTSTLERTTLSDWARRSGLGSRQEVLSAATTGARGAVVAAVSGEESGVRKSESAGTGRPESVISFNSTSFEGEEAVI
jgi:hypothetical protein